MVASPFTCDFETVGDGLERVLNTPTGLHRSRVPGRPEPGSELSHWWHQYLKGVPPTLETAQDRVVRTAELFCGSGGLAQGVKQACQELGYGFSSMFAIDTDPDAVDVYRHNHGTELHRCGPDKGSIKHLLEQDRVEGHGNEARFRYGTPLIADEGVAELSGEIDLLLAGPPCQGHSNLNNLTRRDDERNALYLTVPTFAVAARIPMVIIENVASVTKDHSGIVETAKGLFRNNDYEVDDLTLRADRFGWPQTRSRHFMVARLKDFGRPLLPLGIVSASLTVDPEEVMDVMWAIGELEDEAEDDEMNRRPKLSQANQERIEWFDQNERETVLPRDQRPPSHKDDEKDQANQELSRPSVFKERKSVYGRMKPDKPAPTLTTGFMTPGRGRFVHPTRPRMLTPKEAARIQGFPDDYVWHVPDKNRPTTSMLTKWIGDAVPMPLGHAATLSVLGPGFPT